MIQGYNGLAMVDAKRQIIVAAEPVSSVHVGEHRGEFLDQAEANVGSAGLGERALEGKKLVVDTGYYSEQNIKLCDERGIDAYIPDTQFRSRDPRFPGRTADGSTRSCSARSGKSSAGGWRTGRGRCTLRIVKRPWPDCGPRCRRTGTSNWNTASCARTRRCARSAPTAW